VIAIINKVYCHEEYVDPEEVMTTTVNTTANATGDPKPSLYIKEFMESNPFLK